MSERDDTGPAPRPPHPDRGEGGVDGAACTSPEVAKPPADLARAARVPLIDIAEAARLPWSLRPPGPGDLDVCAGLTPPWPRALLRWRAPAGAAPRCWDADVWRIDVRGGPSREAGAVALLLERALGVNGEALAASLAGQRPERPLGLLRALSTLERAAHLVVIDLHAHARVLADRPARRGIATVFVGPNGRALRGSGVLHLPPDPGATADDEERLRVALASGLRPVLATLEALGRGIGRIDEKQRLRLAGGRVT